MDVFRLVYCSRAAAPFDRDALATLLSAARTRNQRDGLTGILCYAAPSFLQCLEGPRAAVSRALGRIYRDPRHADLTVLDARFVPARGFPDWSMELLPADRLSADVMARAFGEGHYGTARLDTERLLNLLDEVAAVRTPPPRPAPSRLTGVNSYPFRPRPPA